MSILKHEHLFDLAQRLAASPPIRSPRQVDLRRAISSAYYGLFHFMLAALADEFVGTSQRRTRRYGLVYRSVEHRTLREICTEAAKQAPAKRYLAYLPPTGFGPDIQVFARAALELQEARHGADYDPLLSFTSWDAKVAVEAARTAVGCFAGSGRERKKIFLTLLLCPPR
jgi:hypothetical protein